MLRLDCPFCGMRDHSEFTYLEDGSVQMPDFENSSETAWFKAVFLRKNPRGHHVEHWHHTQGCRMVLRVERNTQTHVISAVEAAHPAYRSLLEPASAQPKRTHKTPNHKTPTHKTRVRG